MRDIVTRLCREAGLPVFGLLRFSDEYLLPGAGPRLLQRLPSPARGVIPVVFPYFVGEFPQANVSRYAYSKDYHGICGAYLDRACAALRAAFPGEQFVRFVDSSPLREVRLATAAGLGVLGDNGLLLTERYGSYVFLGEIVTSLALAGEAAAPRGCLHCGRCRAACPGSAIREDGIDRARCVSHISQKKQAFTPEEKALFDKGALVWGCDVCQTCCPLNERAEKTMLPEFYEDVRPVLEEAALETDLSERAYAWRGKDVLRRNLSTHRK